MFWAVLDEGVPHRPTGGARVTPVGTVVPAATR
jgi:hypothetical protein